MSPTPPFDEELRLAALYADDILDSEAEPGFDRVARLTAGAFGAEVSACVAFVDRDRLWAKARVNLEIEQAPREGTLISEALGHPGGLWVEDLACDPTLADVNAIAHKLGVRFFAAAPVLGRDDQPIGAVAAWGPTPRRLDPRLKAKLQDLAGVVADELELRRGRAELQRALEGREAARRQIDAFVAHAPVALAMFDRDMRYLRVSPRWLADYRLPEDIIGRDHYEVIPDARRHVDVHRRALAGEVVREEREILRPDGSPRFSRFEMSPWYDETGAIGGAMITSIDIGDVALARQEAERWRERCELALNLSDTVVWERSDRERKLYAAGPAGALFDRPPTYDDLLQDIAFGIHPEDRPSVQAAWRRHIETGAPYREEHRYARTDGRETWVASIAEARYDGEGRLERVVGVMRDITARKQAELELAKAIEAAEAGSRAKSAFLANMSHELRTPLNGVMGVAGALARTALTPQQREMVGLIEDSAEALERLLGDVLDLTRVESGRMDLNPEPTDVDALVHGVATLFQWRAREKGVGFRVEVQATVRGAWMADGVRLRQVLTNLVSNAVKFTAQGEVALCVGVAPSGRLWLEVSDTGIGFDESVRRRLFRRFEQADASITRRFGGAGLGLAITRGLVRLMGGELEAQSTPGQGSRFRVSLPLKRANAAPGSAGAAAEPASLRGLEVLLAEDHPVNRQVVALILAGAGVALTSVENGAEALERLAAQPFDLVLMDLQMPVMDGVSAIRALRAREAATGAGRLPVIALTAHALPEHLQASHLAGADAHVCKPISAEALLREIARLAAAAPRPSLARSA